MQSLLAHMKNKPWQPRSPQIPFTCFHALLSLALQLAPAADRECSGENSPCLSSSGARAMRNLNRKPAQQRFLHPFLKEQCDQRTQIRLQIPFGVSMYCQSCTQQGWRSPQPQIGTRLGFIHIWLFSSSFCDQDAIPAIWLHSLFNYCHR